MGELVESGLGGRLLSMLKLGAEWTPETEESAAVGEASNRLRDVIGVAGTLGNAGAGEISG